MGAELVDGVVVAAPPGHETARRVAAFRRTGDAMVVVVDRRRDTAGVSRGSARVGAGDPDAFLVHDAARALAPSSLFDAVLRELDTCEAVCPARPVVDTIKADRTDGADRRRRSTGRRSSPSRRRRASAPSSTAARTRQPTRTGSSGRTTSSLVERLGVRVRVVPGVDAEPEDHAPADVVVAEALLAAEGSG